MIDYAQKILELPDAPQRVEALMVTINEEKRRRRDFREWVTPNMKAEFINGEVIIHSPTNRQNWKISNLLSSTLSVFSGLHKLGNVGTEKVMIALTRNDYEPDLVFFSNEKAAEFYDEQVLFPAPDFIVEILSKSTAAKDKGIKKLDYAANGIKEYWIIDPVKEQISQYILFSSTDKQYLPAKIFNIDDDIESWVIKGFIIPVRAIFDEATNLETLQNIIQSV
jgi:Uma2 family endonuclease